MNLEDVAGTQKAAAFLLSLDEQVRVEILRNMDANAAKLIASAMLDLDPELCNSEAVDALVQDLARSAYQGPGIRRQAEADLLTLLSQSHGAEVAHQMLAEIEDRRRRAKPFEFVESFNADIVVRILREESPNVVALVMAHVAPAYSASVLALFEPEEALEIVKRMTILDPPNVDVMLDIGDDLRERMQTVASGPAPRERGDSLRTIADLLTFSQPETEKVVLEGLEEQDESAAKDIREFMFTWTDLAEVDKRSMQKILASVDTRTLSMSLKACPVDVEENIMGNLSSRVKEMVADERELAGAVPFSEVQAARAEIMTAVRGLMESGEFSPARAGEELVT